MTNTTDFVNRYMHNGKNPLGDCYTQPYISEGDTPAFLYSLANGLRSHEDPTFGGWGGCFYKVEGFERVYRDTGFGQLREWVEPAMHDFQARLEWCITPEYNKANHKPIIEVPMGLELVLILGPEAGEARCRGGGGGRPHHVTAGLLADWVGPIPGRFLWLQQPHPAPRVPHQAGEGQRGHHGTTAGCPGPLHPVPDR